MDPKRLRPPTKRRRALKHYEVTPELCSRVELLAAQGLTLHQICHCIGWSFETLCKKRKMHSELVDAIKDGQSKGIAQVTNALFKNAVEKGNLGAQCFYLKTRDRANWGENPVVISDQFLKHLLANQKSESE